MIRKMLSVTTVIAALLLSVLSFGGLTADAGPTCSYEQAINSECADAQAYPGPFTNMPASPTGPYGLGTLNPAAGAASDGVAGLAQTGSESAVLAYAGAGLIAFGAVALGSRRRFFQGTLEV
jgi:LPXTG-motif cell wall-anchored protein